MLIHWLGAALKQSLTRCESTSECDGAEASLLWTWISACVSSQRQTTRLAIFYLPKLSTVMRVQAGVAE